MARRPDAPILRRASRTAPTGRVPAARTYMLACAAVAHRGAVQRPQGRRRCRARHGFNGWLTTSAADPRTLFTDLALLQAADGQREGRAQRRARRPGAHLFTELDPNDLRNAIDSGEGLAITPLAVANGKRNGPREFLLRTQQSSRPADDQDARARHADPVRRQAGDRRRVSTKARISTRPIRRFASRAVPEQRRRAAATGVRGAAK